MVLQEVNMKKILSPETITVNFVPEDVEDIYRDRYHQLPYYQEEGYETEDYGEYTKVIRKAAIKVCIDETTEVENVVFKLKTWYGPKNAEATEEFAAIVQAEIDSGVLEVVAWDDEMTEITFERHSLPKAEEVAV